MEEKVDKVTWAHAFRDIVLEAMRKGSLLSLLGFLCVLIFLIRVPIDELVPFLKDVLSVADKVTLVSFSFNIGLGAVVVFLSRKIRLLREIK